MKVRICLLLVLFIVACNQQNTPTTPELSTPAPELGDEEDASYGVVISEFLTGVEGGNITEFVELYNSSVEPVDLRGWTLNYSGRSDGAEQLVYRWTVATDIPPLGHYLLVHEGADFGVLADATFEVALSSTKGGFTLRDRQGVVVDLVGYGSAPTGFFVGTPAANPERGVSLERLPGGDAGNGVRTGDNSADFTLNPAPNPQNTGSFPTPLAEDGIFIRLDVPAEVEPGTQFTIVAHVINDAGVDLDPIDIRIPLPKDFEAINGTVEKGALVASIPVQQQVEVPVEFTLLAPFTYGDFVFRGYSVSAEGVLASYGAPTPFALAGGSIDIAKARELVGGTVTVEGIATMYTDGFFAGSDGTKFYIEDESGGVQIYIDGARDIVNVNVGDRVRVTGEVEVYRNALEVVPVEASQIEIVETNSAEPIPTTISATQNETDDTILGRLTIIEGVATTITEQTFDWLIELTDEAGNTTAVLIEKQTGVTGELLEVGESYRVTGISEHYSGLRQIKPRFQSDLAQIFPPELHLEVAMPTLMEADTMSEIVATITNHAPETMTNVTVQIDGDYSQSATFAELATGQSESVNIPISSANEDDRIYFSGASAWSDQQVQADAATVEWGYIFIGDRVPIWAIQGWGDRSPYVRRSVTTKGIVTHVAPDLGGFWIQETASDEDPTTSAGIFVLQESPTVMQGDEVSIIALVREMSGQTTLETESVEVLTNGNALPTPIALDPPQDRASAGAYYEPLEGMLVQLTDSAIAVAPTSRYGESVFVYEKWGVDEIERTADVGFTIMIDDSSSARFEERSEQSFYVSKGDRVANVTGVLAYTFENYKIEPLQPLEKVEGERTLPTFDAPDDAFTLATFNVENLFDNADPHPTGTFRPNTAQLTAKLTKIANAIIAMDAPTIIGLQEVENIGVLEQLVALDLLAPFNYTPHLIEGQDSRGIDVAYLVRSDTAQVERVESFPAPEGLTSRPPLLLVATIGDDTIYLLNNHFSSLAGGEEATEPRRTAQAAWNVTLLDQFRTENPDAHYVVMGDLNSFIDTLPIDTLEAANLVHVYDSIGDGQLPYTYIFEGRTQTLDHILVSNGLFDALVTVEALHINADFPLPDFEDVSAERTSDHDPLIAVFQLEK